MFDLFLDFFPGEASDYRFGREPDGAPPQSRPWQEPTSQDYRDPKTLNLLPTDR